jgi:hypothetical protein
VVAKQIVHIINHTRPNHGFGTTHAFLGRLKNEFDRTVQCRLERRKDLCHSETYSGMTIVTTGMHGTLIDRSETLPGGPVAWRITLYYVHCIHIEAESDYRPLAVLQAGHYAREAATH